MLLAALSAEWSAVIVAGLAVVGSGVTGYFAFKAKTAATTTEKAIGTPNGKGDVVMMNEKQLTKMQVIEDKLDFVSDLVLKHISTPNAHGGGSRDPYRDDWDVARR